MRKVRVTIAVAAVAALAFSVFARAQDGPIMIGSSIPLTGGVATFGQHSRWGSELAIAEANAKGGVLGRKLEIDFQDNRCNPAEAVKSVTQMLAEKKYVAILDGLCSSVVLAIMPLVERAGVPLVVANASATSIAERSGVGGNKWTFKVNPTDASMLDALIGWLDKEGKANNIAFLGEDTDFGRAGSTGLENALTSSGQYTPFASQFIQQRIVQKAHVIIQFSHLQQVHIRTRRNEPSSTLEERLGCT